MLETYRPLAAMMTLHLSRLDEIQDDIEMYDDMLEEMWKQLGNQMESNAPSLQKLRDYYNKLNRIDVYNITSRNIEMKHLVSKLIRHYEGLENQLQMAGLNPDELMNDDSVKKVISKLQDLGIPEKLKNLQCTDEERNCMTVIMNAMLKQELTPEYLQILLETPLQKDHLTLLRQFVQRTLVDELLRANGKVEPSHHGIMLPSSMSIRLAMIDQMNQELAQVKTLLKAFRSKKDVFRV
jgi:type II secretory pathway predicted ATPase ExeA